MSLLEKDNFFHGLFSLAGRDSAEKYNLFAEVNKIEEKSKNRTFKNFFSPDLEWENDDDDIVDNEKVEKECNLNVEDIKKNIKFSLDYIRQQQKLKKSLKKVNQKKANNGKDNKNKKRFRKLYQSFKYKYHNIHMAKIEKYKKEGIYKKMNVQQEPIYTPKIDYVYQKISIGPPWSKLSSRRKYLFDEENYITHLSYNQFSSSIDNLKGFIDMSKQTQRNGFPLNGDLRQRYEKKFIPLKYQIKKGKSDNDIDNNELPNFYKTATIERNSRSPINFSFIPYDKKCNHDESKCPHSENRLRNFSKYFKINYRNKNNNIKSIKTNISAPDFKRYLSREHLNRLFKKKDRIVNGVLSPNYKSIESGIKMMVLYRNSYKKLKNSKKEFKGMSSDEVYNANETFEKIYGNKIRAVPLFEKMTSRPQDNDLPCFLNGLSNRMSYYMSTDKALKMNNYSNSKVYNICNEIKEKKDKYVNKHLNKLRKDLGFENVNIFDKNKIEKELEIKSKNFDNLIMKNNL